MTLPKSILKQTNASLPLSKALPVPKTDAEKRRLYTAIEHAQLLEDQKQIQAQNLDAIEKLSEFPLCSDNFEDEADVFTTLVTNFQPSDYDALIEERHANGLCGFALCPNAPRRSEANLSWLRSKGSENWCSDKCAKKALYVKAQLDEVPAWERRGGETPRIVLYVGDETTFAARREHASGNEDLAMERGEKSSSTKVDRVVSKDILEKSTSAAPNPPAVRFNEETHNSIEGYHPKSGVKHDPFISTNGI